MARPRCRTPTIRERVHAVASRGIVPVILGGDHSITWPAATAVADVHGYGNVGIVHFDAHADTADMIEGNLASHGTPDAPAHRVRRGYRGPISSRSGCVVTGRRRTRSSGCSNRA